MKPRLSLLTLGFIALVVLAIGLRLAFYEPLTLSVSNYDSDRYAISSQRSMFTAKFYTNERQPTIALLYTLLESEGGYKVTNLSSPGDQLQPPLAFQPGYDRVAVAQALLSTFAWFILAWVVFRNLRQPMIKLLGATLVLLFAFVPQMAEWDYVMLTEPISLALFILLLALSLEMVARYACRQQVDRPLTILAVLWTFVLILWVFARDTNTYMLLALLGAFGLLATYKRTRAQLTWKPLLSLSAILIILLLTATRAAQLSERWVNPYFNNLQDRVLPIPEHRAFFEARGLPEIAQSLAERGDIQSRHPLFEQEELANWIRTSGPSTYVTFLVSHPLWTVNEFATGVRDAFTENLQPFFLRSGEVTPASWVYLGDLLHPMDPGIILLVVIQLALLAGLAIRRADSLAMAIGGLLVVFFLGEIATLFISIMGDAAGIVRHAIGSLMPLRLSLWLLPPFILDVILWRKERAQ